MKCFGKTALFSAWLIAVVTIPLLISCYVYFRADKVVASGILSRRPHEITIDTTYQVVPEENPIQIPSIPTVP